MQLYIPISISICLHVLVYVREKIISIYTCTCILTGWFFSQLSILGPHWWPLILLGVKWRWLSYNKQNANARQSLHWIPRTASSRPNAPTIIESGGLSKSAHRGLFQVAQHYFLANLRSYLEVWSLRRHARHWKRFPSAVTFPRQPYFRPEPWLRNTPPSGQRNQAPNRP